MPTTENAQELGQFIPLHYHYNMLLDEARMKGFKAALEHVVRPGARVLELGGGTGVLSFFAARNAAKGWCVERNPALVREARRILSMQPGGEKIEVVEADAFDYLPPEPVDVVICEMIHVAMLREQQIPVIESFKQRYLAKFGAPLPAFVPEACLQAVQPVQQDFAFEGYYAPVPLFQNPVASQDRTVELGDPALYQTFTYDEPLPATCEWEGTITATQSGTLNALRFITKNVLAVLLEAGKTIDWFSAYLVLPLAEPRQVNAGDRINVRFSYAAGAPLDALQPQVEVVSVEAPLDTGRAR